MGLIELRSAAARASFLTIIVAGLCCGRASLNPRLTGDSLERAVRGELELEDHAGALSDLTLAVVEGNGAGGIASSDLRVDAIEGSAPLLARSLARVWTVRVRYRYADAREGDEQRCYLLIERTADGGHRVLRRTGAWRYYLNLW